MIKPLLFAASLLSGSGLFAYSATVQETRRAAEQPALAPSPEAVRIVPPAPPMVISEPGPVVVEPAVLELEPVVIEPPARRRVAPAPVVPARTETLTSPCSGWRELGPQNMTSGTATGMHQVREICD
jgi:hypothetical protein